MIEIILGGSIVSLMLVDIALSVSPKLRKSAKKRAVAAYTYVVVR